MTPPKILVFEDTYSLTNHFLKQWIDIVHQALDARGQFTVALSGGRTPIELYCKFSALKNFELWRNSHVFLTDERFVALDACDSNFGMIKKNLFDYIDIPSKNIHPVDTTQKDVSAASQSYEKHLRKFFNINGDGLPAFDLMLLGIGENDGHTASLFPESEDMYEANKWVLGVEKEYLSRQRISLTFPVINNTRNIMFLACGEHKASIVKRVLECDQSLPASLVSPVCGQLTFLLDRKAAKELPYQNSHIHEGDAVVVTL